MAKKRRGHKDDSKPQKKKKMKIDCSNSEQITIEEVFARFPDLSEGIFGRLDDRSLVSCREVSKTWQEYVDGQRTFWIRKILKVANSQSKFHGEWKMILDKTPIETLKEFARFLWLAPEKETSPLYAAGALGDIELFNRIKEKTGLHEDSKECGGSTPFHVAACNNHLNLCKVIIEKIEDKNPGCNDGITPLHQAAIMGHLKLCKLIMTKLPNKNPGNNKGQTPLHGAAAKGHLQVCKLIMGKLSAKNPGCKQGVTPLHTAAYNGQLAVCQLILEKVADVNPKSNTGNTPLHQAAAGGHINIYQLIYEKIAATGFRLRSMKSVKKNEMNPGNNKGVTPLHCAARLGQFELCKFLCLNLEEKNPKDEDGTTPLHVAVKHGQFDICKLLCLNLKEKNPEDEYGRTPVSLAYYDKQWKILHFLIAENNFDCS